MTSMQLSIHVTTDDSQDNYTEWDKPEIEYIPYDFIYIKFWKCKIIDSNRQKICSCLGVGVGYVFVSVGKRDDKGDKKISGVTDMFITLTVMIS